MVDLADQVLGVVQVEGKAEQRRHRRQRDIALVPAELDAERLLAVVHLVADDADVTHARRVRAGMRPGQREARHLKPLGQPAEILFLLLLGTVFFEQLTRPERVRHHHGDAGGNRAAGDLRDHLALRLRRKPQTAIFAGDQHAQKPVILQVLPDLRGHIGTIVSRVPVVDHGADGVHRPIEERLLLGRERRLADAEQLFPTRPAREQFGIPADSASIERFLLGAADPRQDGFDEAIGRPDHHGAPHRRQRQQPEDDRRQQRKDPADTIAQQPESAIQRNPAQRPDHQRRQCPLPERRATHGERRTCDNAENQENEGHARPPRSL